MGLAGGAAPEVLTPPRSPGRDRARRSGSRSGSRGRLDGAGGATNGSDGANGAPTGAGAADPGEQTVRRRAPNYRRLRNLRRIGRRGRPGEGAPSGAGSAPAPTRTSDAKGAEAGPPDEGVSVRTRQVAAAPKTGPPARRTGGTSPHPQRTVAPVSAVEEVAFARGLPAARTLSVSPIRWEDHGTSAAAAPGGERPPSRADAPWKRENRVKKKSRSRSPPGKKGKGKNQKGQKGSPKGQGKSKKGGKGQK